MKIIISKILIISIVFTVVKVNADEGMFLPMFIKRLNYENMQNRGLKLTPEEIYSVNNSSLKDAVVIFSGFCTGELISSQGLILTNHHCGYGAIANLSTPEDDILKNGFWAKEKKQEKPAEGIYVSFLDRMEDVTEEFEKELNDDMSADETKEKTKEIKERIIEREKKKYGDANGIEVVVKDFFKGNEFYMFVYKKYTDVRLVGTPPSSVGKYGADTDNWMWPRHTGDFSIFRVYADKDGNPAEYSENNVPLEPKKYLSINIKGLKEGDYAMVMGYPGSTQRYMPSFGVKRAVEVEYSKAVETLEEKINVMAKYMKDDPQTFINYASPRARFSNTWKNRQGMIYALNKLNVIADKQKQEKEFEYWVNENEKRIKKYGDVMSLFERGYSKDTKYVEDYTTYRYSLLVNSIVNATITYSSELEGEFSKDEIKEKNEEFWEKHNYELEKELFIVSVSRILDDVSEENMADELKGVKKDDLEKIFESSIFSSEDNFDKFIDNFDKKKLEDDKFLKIVKACSKKNKEIRSRIADNNNMIDKAYKLYVRALREMNPKKIYAPDANFTMRVTYGNILPYTPKDAVTYSYYTTIEGVMEKYKKDDWEFDLPQEFIDIYNRKDYGIYKDKEGNMPVCFITNNDITGGNSGSPVLNSNGELIGTAFDGNWDAMSGDIKFDDNLQRTIVCDIRYVLFIVDKLGGAKNIIDEMTIIK